MKTEYNVSEVYALAGLPPSPTLRDKRRLNLALTRWGWRRYRGTSKTSKFTWVPPSPEAPQVPQIGSTA